MAALLIVVTLSVSIYRFLPNHKVKLRYQLPGAIFTAFGWAFASFLFPLAIFPIRIFREPTFTYSFALLEEFHDAPERGEGENSE